MRNITRNLQKQVSKADLESKLRNIAKLIGEVVVFKIIVDNAGKASIIGIETDYDEEEDEDEAFVYPVIKKTDIRKPLVYLDYIG
ncbi:hypothetical protein J4458_03330 [Candidatus Woesearchaeota archaeon]|nr:hypothetical protein [Candidatus Woesearchaeota archaeon]